LTLILSGFQFFLPSRRTRAAPPLRVMRRAHRRRSRFSSDERRSALPHALTLAGRRRSSPTATPVAWVVRTSVHRFVPLPTVPRRARLYSKTGERPGSETETSMTQTIAHEHPDTAPLTAVFIDVLKQTKRFRPIMRPWRRKDAHGDGDLRCIYCNGLIAAQRDMTAGRRPACAALIIPAQGGGNVSGYDNVVPCCIDCRALKAARDLLEWRSDIDDELRARRLRALHASLNHVVPLTARTAAGAEEALRRRWTQPRFRALGNVFMQYGFLAWPAGSLPSAQGDGLMFVLQRTFGAADVSPDRVWTVFRLPRETWHAAAWLLIEANALLVKVDLPSAHAIRFPAWDPVSLPDEHHGRWWVTLPADTWIEDVVRYWKRMALARRAARAEVDE